MTNTIPLVIDVTLEEQQRIEAQARQHGYATPRDYLLALVELDADDDDSDNNDADTKNAELLNDLRESLREAIEGKTMSLEEMWAIVESDDE